MFSIHGGINSEYGRGVVKMVGDGHSCASKVIYETVRNMIVICRKTNQVRGIVSAMRAGMVSVAQHLKVGWGGQGLARSDDSFSHRYRFFLAVVLLTSCPGGDVLGCRSLHWRGCFCVYSSDGQ